MNNMIVSVNPHIYAKDTTQTIMRDVLIALFPAVIASIVFFGVRPCCGGGVRGDSHGLRVGL